ncbi:MAG: GspE/PulE family protein [Phycisphaerales bacterium]
MNAPRARQVVTRDELASGRPTAEFLSLIPREFARRRLLCSVGISESGHERLLVSSRTTPSAIVNVAIRIGRQVDQHAADCGDEEVARYIDRVYDQAEREQQQAEAIPATGMSTGPVHRIEEPLQGETVEGALREALSAASLDRDLLHIEGKGPVVRLVDAMLFEALGMDASDIHIQPLATRTLVRYRVDGVLVAARDLPHTLANSIVSRIKVMAQMDVAERNAPQDGRATVTTGRPGPSGAGTRVGRAIDLRMSTLPTNYGERAVIRLLDNSFADSDHDAGGNCVFAALGMPANVRTLLLDKSSRSHGIVLVTGPTGSGKTTTLYTLLREIARTGTSGRGNDLNLMTIEDPIEYDLSATGMAISQSQINLRKGISFATGLRHILRQDPDVVMVGEIRDTETARIALQASLTGHMVFSTLHTNDASSAITRLVDLGAEPFLVAAALSAVMAQRLVRRVHAECSGAGCAECLNAGYKGRVGVFEFLALDEPLRQAVARGAKLDEVREHARRRGMRTLWDEGQRLIESRITDEREVRRVLQGMADEETEELQGAGNVS